MTDYLNWREHDLKFGWHAFLWYKKLKGHKYVTKYIISKSLLSVWNNIQFQIYQKIPVSPLEAFTQPALIDTHKLAKYEKLLRWHLNDLI